MAVGDVAHLVAHDGFQLLRRGLLPDVDRAQKREGGDLLQGSDEREAPRAGDFGTAAQVSDAYDLRHHHAGEQRRAECEQGDKQPRRIECR